MNMKKTIAAVAAGAVALSAMATTVSAESGSLHYNLVNTEYSATGSVTYTATYSNAITATDGYLNFYLNLPSVCDASTACWTITGTITETDDGAVHNINYVNYYASDITWNANASSYITQDWAQQSVFSIPLTAAGITNDGNGAYAALTIQVVVPHTDTTWGYSVLNTAELTAFESTGAIYYGWMQTDASYNGTMGLFVDDDDTTAGGYDYADGDSDGTYNNTAGTDDMEISAYLAALTAGDDYYVLSVTGSNYVYPSEAVSTQ
ncbi:MAG: hypothetical protein LUI05_02905, partial [Oscillospiraceae bacterium]|nr:hypothetical protein [Oscillospiraceae bacterium]